MRERLIPLLRGWPLVHSYPSNLGGAVLWVPLCSPCRRLRQGGWVAAAQTGIYWHHFIACSCKVAAEEPWALPRSRTGGCRVGARTQGRLLCGSPGTRTLVLSRALVARGTAQSAATHVVMSVCPPPLFLFM